MFGNSRRRTGGRAGPRSLLVLGVGAAVLSWLGLFVHNVADLPGQTIMSPEILAPGLLTVILVIVWLSPARRIGAWLLLVWAWLNLVGGGLISVLPLPFLHFAPEQSVRHYLFHLLYGACQVPLILVLTRILRRRTSPA